MVHEDQQQRIAEAANRSSGGVQEVFRQAFQARYGPKRGVVNEADQACGRYTRSQTLSDRALLALTDLPIETFGQDVATA